MRRQTAFDVLDRQARPGRVAAVVNPSKKNWQAARDQTAQAVAAAGLPELSVYLTTVAEPGEAQARQAVADGHDLVLALGGDGTVREVALGLLGSDTALGLAPLGTANLFARNVGLDPKAFQRNLEVALGPCTAAVDIGVARICLETRWSGEHAFLVLAGIGNDAATVIGTRDHLKNRLGWLAYFESGVRHVLRRPIPMSVRLDDGATAPGEYTTVDAWSILAGNCGRVPGGIVLFPAARLDDGLLDTMIVSVTHVGQWAAIGAKGLLRFSRDVPGMQVGRTRQVWVRPAEPAPVQLDGDVFSDVEELHVRVIHQGLRLKVPLPADPRPRRRSYGTR